jgi:PiT family inorganic phosphate transporter
MPVSTTHTLVGAIIGVAFARGLGAVNKGVTLNIFSSWLITFPAAALLAVILFLLGRTLLMDTVASLIQFIPNTG